MRASKSAPSKKTLRFALLPAHLAADRNESPDPLSLSAVTPTAILRRPDRVVVKTENPEMTDDETNGTELPDSSSAMSEELTNFNDGEWVLNRTLKSVIGLPNAHRHKRAKTPFDIEAVMAERKAEAAAAALVDSRNTTLDQEPDILPSIELGTRPVEQLSNLQHDASRASALRKGLFSRSPTKPGDKQTLGDRPSTTWEIHRNFLRAWEAQKDEARRMAAVIAEGEDVLWG
ncbi:hypothetical protein CORC01_00076 [Colletotrichum orchidophilum]|uniref:Uncharacterized protein n=1 Tax=Colletotrichum orchidophilum TaxID=1209926 RepID=A0A1G4BTC0_9PEZI|nr:uncharacterized protein CORC01_00076 [Colletotrichum orchidophilum]OHF04605.1 hypothetical protein CORC01_00076 [Colletotrichum orchidophilum]